MSNNQRQQIPDDDEFIRIQGGEDALDRLLRGQGSQAASDTPIIKWPARLADMGPVLECLGTLADGLETLALAYARGIVNPSSPMGNYARGRSDGLAWAAEQLRSTIAELAG